MAMNRARYKDQKDLNDKIRTLQKKNQDFKDKVSGYKQENEAIKSSNEALIAKVSALNNIIKSSDQKLNDMEREKNTKRDNE